MLARVARIALAATLLFGLGPLSADHPPQPDVTLSAPIAVLKGGHSVCGLTMSNAVRARFRAQGGKINVEWRSSQGRGCLTRLANAQGFDAAFDMAGLGAGQVSLTGVVTIGQDPVSGPVATNVAQLTVSPLSATAQPLTHITPTLTVTPGTVRLDSQPATFKWTSPLDGSTIQQGSFPTSTFQLNNSGNLVAQPSIFVPQTTLGTVTLQFSVGVQSTDTLGNPVVIQATTSMTVAVQGVAMPLSIMPVTPNGTHVGAGTSLTLQFNVVTSDPPNTTAACSVFDSTFTLVASGSATLSGAASPLAGSFVWAVPSTAAGNHSIIIAAQRVSGIDTEVTTAQVGIVVDPAAGPTVAITTAGPLMTMAGQPATIGLTIRNLASLSGVTLVAAFRDRTTGAVVLTSSIDPATLAKQPDGSLTASFMFTFPSSQVNAPLDTNCVITLSVNGTSVASSNPLEVIVAPAPAPVSAAIISAPTTLTPGIPAPLTVGVTVAPAQVSSLFWSILDAQGGTAATGGIPATLLVPVGTQFQATVQMSPSTSLAAGAYTLALTLVTTAGQTVTTSQPIQVLPAVTLRFTQADGDMVEGQPEVIEAVLDPQIPVGGATWYFLNGYGGVAAGFPTGTLAPADFTPILDNGAPAWLLHIVVNVPPGTVTGPTSVSFVLSVTNATGLPLAPATTGFAVQPVVPTPVVTGVAPTAALPLQKVTIQATGLSPRLSDDKVLLYADGTAAVVSPESVSPLVFVVPANSSPGAGFVGVLVRGTLSNFVPITILSPIDSATIVGDALRTLSGDHALTAAQRSAALQAANLLEGSADGHGDNGFTELFQDNQVLPAMLRLDQTASVLAGRGATLPGDSGLLATLAATARAVAGAILANMEFVRGSGDPLVVRAQGLFTVAGTSLAAGDFPAAITSYDAVSRLFTDELRPAAHRCQVFTQAEDVVCLPIPHASQDIRFSSSAVTNPPDKWGEFYMDLFDPLKDPGLERAMQRIADEVKQANGVPWSDDWDGHLFSWIPVGDIQARPEPYLVRSRFVVGDDFKPCQFLAPVYVVASDTFWVDPPRAVLCAGDSKVFKSRIGCPDSGRNVTDQSIWTTSFKPAEAKLVNRSTLQVSADLSAVLDAGLVRSGQVRAHYGARSAKASVNLVSDAGIIPSSFSVCHVNEVVDFDLHSCEKGVVDSAAVWSIDPPSIGKIDEDGILRVAANHLPPGGTTGTVTAKWNNNDYTATVKVLPADRIAASAPTAACVGQPFKVHVALSCHAGPGTAPATVVVRDVSATPRFQRHFDPALPADTVGEASILEGDIEVLPIAPSDARFDATLRVELADGVDTLFDEVDLTVFNVQLDIHNGQGGPVVAADKKFSVGAFTVANLNDSSNNGVPDKEGNGQDGDEVDLMELDLQKPQPDLGGNASLRVVSGDVRLWTASARGTQIPVNGGTVEFPLSQGSWPQRVWIEAPAPSHAVRDIALQLEYGDGVTPCADKVRATAIWVEEPTFRNAGGLSPDDTDAALVALFTTGTGGSLGPVIMPNQQLQNAGPPDEFINGVELGFTVKPPGVGTEPGVRFDCSQRVETHDQNQHDQDTTYPDPPLGNLVLPPYDATPNDEQQDTDDSNTPVHDHVFHIDGPGVISM